MANPKKKCTVDGCDQPHKAKGLCKSHYGETRYKRPYARREALRCEAPDCEGLAASKGLCRICYERARRAAPGFAEKERLRLQANPTQAEKKRAGCRAQYDKNREARNEYDRARHHAKKEERAAKEQARREANPEIRRKSADRSRLLLTGWTRQAFDAALAAQGGCCDICRERFQDSGARRVAADHWEPNGVKTPRALLCTICNTSLGSYEKYLRPLGLLYPIFEQFLARHGG